MTDNLQTSTPKERFDILYHSLERSYERFITSSVTVAGLVLVLIGWLLTSETAQKFFLCSTGATIVTVLLIGGLIYIYTSSILNVFNVNHSLHKMIKTLCYIEEEYYEHHLLPNRYKYFGLGLNLCSFSVAGLLIVGSRLSFIQIGGSACF